MWKLDLVPLGVLAVLGKHQPLEREKSKMDVVAWLCAKCSIDMIFRWQLHPQRDEFPLRIFQQGSLSNSALLISPGFALLQSTADGHKSCQTPKDVKECLGKADMCS